MTFHGGATMRSLSTLATLLLGLAATAALVVSPLNAGHRGGGTGHGGGSGGITLGDLSCTEDQIAKYDGTNWVCAADEDTDTDTLATLPCANGEVVKSDGAGGWVCAADDVTDTLVDINCVDGEFVQKVGLNWTCLTQGELLIELGLVKRVFLSSLSYQGDLGDLAGAHAKCQSLADAELLGGTWKAWIAINSGSRPATNFSAKSKFVGWRLLDGSLVADSFGDLIANGPSNPIFLTEDGSFPASDIEVWTNVEMDGDPIGFGGEDTTCSFWTDNTVAFGAATGLASPSLGVPPICIGFENLKEGGDPVTPENFWTYCRHDFASCDVPKHLYCFEQ